MATHSSILVWRIPGQRSLMGYGPQGCTELDTTEATQHAQTHSIYQYILYHVIKFTFSWFSDILKVLKIQSLSCVQLFAIPWIVDYQAPPSMGFSRQEYWSGLQFTSPEDLPDPGIEPRSPTLQADTLRSEPPGESLRYLSHIGNVTLLSHIICVQC